VKHEKKITKIKNVTAIRCGIEEILTLLTGIMHLNYVGGIYAHIQAGKRHLYYYAWLSQVLLQETENFWVSDT